MVLEIKGLTKHPHRTPGLVCIHKCGASTRALFHTPGITFAQRFFCIHLSSNEQCKKLHFKEERRGRRIKKNPLLVDAFKWNSISVAFSYPASEEGKAKNEELKRCRDERSTSPFRWGRLGLMANTAEPERAGRGQDRQEEPVLGSLPSWGGAGGQRKENTAGSRMGNYSLERQLGDRTHHSWKSASLGQI